MLKRLSVTLIYLTLGLSACGGGGTPQPDLSSAPSPSPASQILTGVVVAIDGQGLDEVNSFTLRVDGTNHEIFIDPNREYAFALGHLHAHLQGAEPVTVTYEEGDGQLIAISIEDA